MRCNRSCGIDTQEEAVMAGKKKMLFSLCAALLILTAALVFLLHSKEKEEKPEASGGTCMLTDFEAEEINRISIENKEGNYSIAKDGKEWVLTGYEDYKIEEDSLETAVRNLLSISADIIFEEPFDRKAYGLEEPEAKVNIRGSFGETTLYLGSFNEGTSSWYVCKEGQDGLFSIGKGIGDWMVYSPFVYFDTILIPPIEPQTERMTERLTGIVVERPDLEEPLRITVAEEPAQAYTSSYELTSPVHVKTSLKAMNEEIGSLLGFSADSVKGWYQETEAAAYGMDRPAMVMTVSHDGVTDTFTIGAAAGEGTDRYMICSNSKLLYTIAEDKLVFLHASADDLFFELALLPDINKVQQVSLKLGEEEFLFLLTRQEKGQDGEELTVTVNGQEVDASDFRSFYSFLLEVDIEKINTDVHEGNPVMRIDYIYQDGTGDTVEAYPLEDARRMGVVVNGEPEFEGRIAYLDKVRTELIHLLTGEEIDTNW